MVRPSTSSTDADEMLPCSRMEFQLWARASGGMPIAFSIDSSTLGPPGWQIHVEMSSGGQSVIGEEAVDLVAEVGIGHLRHVLGHDELESIGGDIPPHDVDGAREEPAAGVQHLGARLAVGLLRNPVRPGGDHGRRAIAEQAHADERRD